MSASTRKHRLVVAVCAALLLLLGCQTTVPTTMPPEEIDAAVALVLADPALGRIIEDLKVYVSGGFILDEPAGKSCGPRTRCLQIFAFRLGSGGAPLFRAVVDLTKNKIVYRDSWNQGVPQ